MSIKESPKNLALIGFTVAIIALGVLIFWLMNGFAGQSFAANMNGQWALELLPFLLVCIIGGVSSGIIGVTKSLRKH